MRLAHDAWLKIRFAAAALAVGLAGMATAPTAIHAQVGPAASPAAATTATAGKVKVQWLGQAAFKITRWPAR